MHYVYVLKSQSRPDKTYTGYTNDLDRRLSEHNSPNSGYTGRFQPWTIEAYIACDSEHTAQIVEAYFKNSSGQEKFNNFAEANPHHANPKQGFFDTLIEGRAFGSGERRFKVMRDAGSNVLVMA